MRKYEKEWGDLNIVVTKKYWTMRCRHLRKKNIVQVDRWMSDTLDTDDSPLHYAEVVMGSQN